MREEEKRDCACGLFNDNLFFLLFLYYYSKTILCPHALAEVTLCFGRCSLSSSYCKSICLLFNNALDKNEKVRKPFMVLCVVKRGCCFFGMGVCAAGVMLWQEEIVLASFTDDDYEPPGYTCQKAHARTPHLFCWANIASAAACLLVFFFRQ
jgi:hypothetical protein